MIVNHYPYGYVDKRDIMWSKTVWEKIDLNQKVNYPLLYPLDSNRLRSKQKIIISGFDRKYQKRWRKSKMLKMLLQKFMLRVIFNRKKTIKKFKIL